MTLIEAGRMLRERRVSCLELLEEAIRVVHMRNAELNTFLTITEDAARSQARRLDDELAAGHDRGPLHGIPIALKDLFYTAGVRTTNGSAIFRDFVPAYDATVVEKLKEAGAVSIGKTNMHEIAYGITSTNPHFGPVRNPHNVDCIPGGSSGGSGAAVACGMVFMAMGSDTGGSIRIPAAYCGTVGLKPTFGRTSRYGCFQLGLTLDHMGPLTRSVADAAVVLRAISGYDPRDEGTGRRPVPAYTAQSNLAGVRIGRPKSFYFDTIDPGVRTEVDNAFALAEQRGARIVSVQIPDVTALNTIARTILLAEASAVMSPYLHRRTELGPDVLALLDHGRLVPAIDYINAQRVRRRMQRDWAKLFESIDVLFTPTAPIVAPRIGQATVTINGTEEDTRLATTRFVRGINALGLPALSIPCGKAAGLPVSLQIVGRAWDEQRILDVGAALESMLPDTF